MGQAPEQIRLELSGEDIMRILGVEPGPQVGRAYKYLFELQRERGRLGREMERAELLAWAKREGIAPPVPNEE